MAEHENAILQINCTAISVARSLTKHTIDQLDMMASNVHRSTISGVVAIYHCQVGKMNTVPDRDGILTWCEELNDS